MEDLEKLMEELGKLISERLRETPYTFMLMMTDGVEQDRAYSSMTPDVAKTVLANVYGGIVADEHEFLQERKNADLN